MVGEKHVANGIAFRWVGSQSDVPFAWGFKGLNHEAGDHGMTKIKEWSARPVALFDGASCKCDVM
jgi:hypothetical protein